MNVLDCLVGDPDVDKDQLKNAIGKVKARRAERRRPDLDDKILVSWNALMISGLCRAYRVLGDEPFLKAALKATNFILKNLIEGDCWFRSYRGDSRSNIKAFADDHAFMIQALLDVYEVVLDQFYLDQAISLQDQLDKACWNPSLKSFTIARGDSEDTKIALADDHDGAEPSTNSIAAMNLSRLHLLMDDVRYAERKEQLFRSFAGRLAEIPHSMPALLDAFQFDRSPKLLVVEASSLDEAKTMNCLPFDPNLVVKAIISPGAKLSAHICRDRTCSGKVYDPQALLNLAKNWP